MMRFRIYRVLIKKDAYGRSFYLMGDFKTLEEANVCLNKYKNLHDKYMYIIIMESENKFLR